MGLGFATALAAVVAVWDALESEQYLSAESGVEVIEHREMSTGYGLRVVGTVKNGGEAAWRNVQVSVKFYDNDGNFLGSFEDYVDGVLPPGEVKEFSVECGWEKRPLPPYGKYIVDVVDGYRA